MLVNLLPIVQLPLFGMAPLLASVTSNFTIVSAVDTSIYDIGIPITSFPENSIF